MAIGPFEVGYPVDFRSGGDTTKEAFSKHIQEIQRIYGYLNALNTDKLSASEYDASALPNHISSTNPHPNWLIDLASQVTGLLPAAKVSGLLTNANINTSNVNNLNSFVQGLIDASMPGEIEFIAQTLLNGQCHGYVNFPGGLQIRFGQIDVSDLGSEDTNEETLRVITFYIPFTHNCFVVSASLVDKDSTVARNKNWTVMTHVQNISSFSYHMELNFSGASNISNIAVNYIAIGH